MDTINIPVTAAERNKAWIKAVTETLGTLNDESFCRCVMKAAGKECAMQMHEIILGHLEQKPCNVEEMIEAINARQPVDYQLGMQVAFIEI